MLQDIPQGRLEGKLEHMLQLKASFSGGFARRGADGRPQEQLSNSGAGPDYGVTRVIQDRRCANCTAINPWPARFCSSCGAAFADPKSHTEPRVVNRGWLGVIGIVAAIFILGAIFNSNGSGSSLAVNTAESPTPALTPTPTYHQLTNQEIAEQNSARATDVPAVTNPTEAPKPQPPPVDLHAKRAAVKEWWGRAVMAIGIPYTETYLAIKTGLESGDTVAAASAAHHAHQIDCEQLPDAPDGLSSVNDRVRTACAKMNAGVSDLSAYFDSETPGDAARVSDEVGEVRQLMDDARVSLVQHYTEWGGNPKDLVALDDVRALGDALSNATK